MKKRVILNIFGRVQNIGFRYYTAQKANKLKIAGWVKNESDGSVKILAEGEEESLKKLLLWCSKGPRFAQIDKIDVKWQDYKGKSTSFKIIY